MMPGAVLVQEYKRVKAVHPVKCHSNRTGDCKQPYSTCRALLHSLRVSPKRWTTGMNFIEPCR